MYLSQKEKKRHPEYEQYIALFEETITQMESGARGRGAPEAIIERCLDKALEFYDADSAALVETNLDLGYGVCVSEHCKTGMRLLLHRKNLTEFKSCFPSGKAGTGKISVNIH